MTGYQAARELAVDLRRLITPTSQYQIQRRPVLVRRRSLLAVGAVVVFAALATFDVGGWRERLANTGRAAHIESVAVLPLQNLSGDPAQDFLADGITEELITELARTGSLQVISRTSIMQYKSAKKPLTQIARELNVDAIVEGSVLRSGDRVRVTAQLIRAANDRHIWADTFENDVRDILSLQDSVALAITNRITGQVMRKTAAMTKPHAVSPEAYEAYVKGNSYLDRWDMQTASEYFSQAIKLDPQSAPAYAHIARAYFWQGFLNLLSPSVAFARAQQAAMKALELDPNLPDAHGALALVKLHNDWDWAGSEQEFKRALQLNPNDADIRHDYAHYLMAAGRLAESVAESDRAVQLDPLGDVLSSCLCWHNFSARQYDAAIQQARKFLRTSPDNDWEILGWSLEQQHKYPEAIVEFQNALRLSPDNTMYLASLAHAYAATEQRKSATDILVNLKEHARKTYVSSYDIAVIYLGMGDNQAALQWLEKAYSERASSLVYSRFDPRLDPLRSEPRFVSLMRRMNLA